jgi:hypothetical protein
MAIAVRGTPTTAETASNTLLTQNVPTNQDGDLLLWVISNGNTNLISPPTGWIDLASFASPGADALMVWYRIAASEPASYDSGSRGAASGRCSGIMIAYSGVDQTTPFDVTTPTPIAGTTTTTCPAITPTTSGAWVLAFAAALVGVGVVNAVYTSSNTTIDQSATSTSGASTNNVSAVSHAAWSSGAFTPLLTCSQATTRGIGGTAALRPAAGGGGPTIEFTEDFEGAADGVGATASTTSFDVAFQASATMTHSTLRSILGTRSLRFLNPTVTQYLYKSYSPARTVIYQRLYFYMADWTEGTTIMGVQTGTSLQSNVQVPVTAGKFRLRDGTTVTASSTMTPVIGQWYRLETKTDYGAATHALRIFTGANLHGTTADEELSGSMAAGVGGYLQLEDASGDIQLEDASGSLVTEDYVAGSSSFDRAFVGTNAANTLDWFVDSYANSPDGWVGPADTGAPSFVDTSKFFLVL